MNKDVPKNGPLICGKPTDAYIYIKYCLNYKLTHTEKMTNAQYWNWIRQYYNY